MNLSGREIELLGRLGEEGVEVETSPKNGLLHGYLGVDIQFQDWNAGRQDSPER